MQFGKKNLEHLSTTNMRRLVSPSFCWLKSHCYQKKIHEISQPLLYWYSYLDLISQARGTKICCIQQNR